MNTSAPSPFQQLTKFLQEHEIQHTVKEASKELPFDVVLIALGMDAEEKPIVLQVHHYQHELTAPSEEQEGEEPAQNLGLLHVLSFLLTHPTELPQDAYGEIGRLLMFANKSLPMGALSFSELEKCCYYQFSLPSTTEEIQNATFQAIFNTILFAKEVFFDIIRDVIEGKTTVDEILKSAQEGQPPQQ